VSLESSAAQELFKQNLGTTVQHEIDDSKAKFKGLRQSFAKYFPVEAQTKDTGDAYKSNEAKGDWEDNHTMVLLGGRRTEVLCKKRNERVDKDYFLVLNSWPQMPLILFSHEYLEACGARVLFRAKAVSEGERSKFATNENRLAVGMASPCSLFEEEISDLWGGLSRLFDDEEKEPEEKVCVARCPFNDDDDVDY